MACKQDGQRGHCHCVQRETFELVLGMYAQNLYFPVKSWIS